MTDEQRRLHQNRGGNGVIRFMRALIAGSMRTKLLVAFLIVSLVPLLAFAYINHRSTLEALNNAAYHSLAAAAQQSASRLSGFVEANIEIIGAEARLPALADFLSMPRVLSSFAPLHEECRSILKSFAEKNSVFINSYGLIGTDGTVLVDTRREKEGWSEARQEYFEQAMNTGLPSVSGVDYIPEYGQAFIHFASPVLDKQGKVLGVLRSSYSIAIFQQMLAQDAGIAGDYSAPLLVDARGRILAFGRLSHTGLAEYLLKPVHTLTSGGQDGENSIRNALESIPTAARYFTTHLKLGDEGPEAVAMTEVPSMDWRVFFLQPEGVFLAPAHKQTQWLGGLAAAISFVAIFAAAITSRVMTRPITKLTEATRRVTRGDLRVKAPVYSEDEIGSLARAFNAMTGELERRIETENTLADISREFINVPANAMAEAMHWALTRLATFLGLDMGMVLLSSGDTGGLGRFFELRHIWHAPGLEPEHDHETLRDSSLDWLEERLRTEGAFHIPKIDDLPEEAESIRRAFAEENVRSLAVLPFFCGGEFRGMLCLATLGEREVEFSEEHMRLIRLVSEIFGNTLERHESQEALRQSEERYALAQKAANIGSWEWDITTGRLYWSDALEPLFGYENGEFQGTYKAFLDRVHPDDRKMVLDAAGASFRRGASYNVEHRILRKDGEERWVAEVGEVVLDAEGRPQRMRGILQDITERKWAEDLLSRLNRQLEQLVEARTKDLENKAHELEEANKRLLALDEMKSTFLTSVSHELRTPLTSVLGFTRIIMRDFRRMFLPIARQEGGVIHKRSERILENLAIIADEGDRLTRMVNDVLDLSKIESGRMVWRDREIDLKAAINQAIRSVGGQLRGKPEVSLKVRVEEDMPRIQMDPDRLSQLLLNIVGNAVKFTEHGKVVVQACAPTQDAVQVRVKDSGSGIEREELGKIFDKFHQAARRDKVGDKPPGTGLGLSICQQIVEYYGGILWVESEPGKGSTFVFELPVHNEESVSGAASVRAV